MPEVCHNGQCRQCEQHYGPYGMPKGARLARPDFVTVQINHLATLTLDETHSSYMISSYDANGLLLAV